MSRKFDTVLAGLRDTYPSPDPDRMEEFLRTLPSNQREDSHTMPLFHTGKQPMWFALPAVVAAAVVLTVGIGVYRRNPPHSVPSIIETTTYTETVTEVNRTELPSETTAASSLTAAGSQTTVTGAASTAATSPTTAAVTTRSAVSGDSTATSALSPVRTTESAPAVTSPAEHTAIVPTEPGIAANTAHTTAGTSATTEKRSTFTIVRETTTLQSTKITQKQTGTFTGTTTTTIATTYTGECVDSPAVDPASQAVEPESPTDELQNDAAPAMQEFPMAVPTVRYDVPAQYETWVDFQDVSEAGESDGFPTTDENEDSADAEVIVVGRVADTCCTSFKGYPYTVYTIYAEEVIKGSYAPGYLTVWQIGGYIPLSELTEHFEWVRDRTATMTASEIAETMIFEDAPQPLREADGILRLFLQQGDGNMPPGAFRVTQIMESDSSFKN